MGKGRAYNRLRVTLLLAVMLMTVMTLHVWADVRPADVATPASGNVFINVEGSFSSATKDEILTEINRIRKEAFELGYVKKYVPLTWSASLEKVAMLRAVEADLLWDHSRPSGKTWYDIYYENHTSNAENLAWNGSGTMQGIKQWYDEIEEYKKKLANQSHGVTGHYENLIMQDMQSIGVACFQTSDGTYCITSESGRFTDSNQEKSSLSGPVTQLMETNTQYLSDPTLVGETGLKTGGTSPLTLKVTATYPSDIHNSTGVYAITEGVAWTSSDPSVATVDENGTVTAVGPGDAVIKATIGSLSASVDIGVDKDDLQYAKVTLDKESYEYCAAKIEPAVTVTLLGETLTEGEDYSVSYSDNVNAGEGKVILTGLGDREGQSAKVGFTISKLDPTSMRISPGSYTYTGSAITPSLLFLGSKGFLAVPEEEYTITYNPEPVNVGSISFELVGNDKNLMNSGTWSGSFTIRAATIPSTVIEDQPYTGSAIEPELSITYNGLTLVKDTDYTVTFSNNTAVGRASAKITGKGNYTGSRTVYFKITAAPLQEDDLALTGDGTYEYTGSKIEPGINVTHSGRTLTKDTDYTVTYADNADVGTATVTVTGKGNYTGEVSKTFTISPAALIEEMITLGDEPTYTGAEVKTTVTVTWNEKKLTEGTDYTCTYSDNVNAGENSATVAITGTGNFGGNVPMKFSILPADLSYGTISGLKDAEYTGSAIKEAPVVKVGEMTLTENTDYTVTYSDDLVNTGTVTVTVTGKGNYTGTLSGSYEITAIDITEEGKIEEIEDQAYTGSSIQPDVNVILGESTLKPGIDYTVTYGEDTINTGEVSVTARGIGNYSGTLSGSYKITPADISGKGEIGEIADQSYTGSEIRPDVNVTFGGSVLTKDTDYTVTYADNTDAGTATVTVTGKGNYTGEVSKTFTISPVPLTQEMITLGEAPTYTGSAVKAAVTVTWNEKQLTENTDYTCTYSKNEDAGEDTASVTITGTGNFEGSVTKVYSILPADLSDGTISGLKDAEYTGSAIKETPVVKVGEMTLTENTDYKVTYSDDLVNMGTVTVTVTGTGNYTGTLSRSYEITLIDISKEGKIEAIADQPYTGSSIEPDVKVTFGESALTRDTDYTVSYAGNTNAGTASVTVTGTGNYKGKVTGSFAITPADLTEEMVTLGTDPSYTGSNVQAGVTVTWNGKKLEENTDYTCTYSNNTAVGTNTASVTINGKGNFRGSVAKTFSIMQADLSKGSISGLSNAVYTGSEIKQNPVVKVGGTKLNEGTDYTVSFSDDLVNIGTVTVTVTGKGNYTGTLTGSYKIQEKPKETEEEQKETEQKETEKPHGNTPKPDPVLGTVTTMTAAAQTLPENGDIAGSSFAILQVKAKKVTKKSIKIAWKPVKGAAGYIIFGAPCGSKYSKLTEVKATSFTQKGLKKGKYYKYFVAARDRYGNILATSKTVHIATSGGKKGNTKSVKLNKKKVTLKKGKKFKLKATLKNGSLKVAKHRKVAYESDNPAVATVSKSGKIKAVGVGTCRIYAYAQNGVFAKCKVKVKAK